MDRNKSVIPLKNKEDFAGMTPFNSSLVEIKERNLQDLILRYRNEGRKSSVFREVFELMYQDVYHYFFQRISPGARGQQMAEDLAQDVFLRVSKSVDQFDPSKKIGPWFWRIVRNRLIDEYRMSPGASLEELEESDLNDIDLRDPESELLNRMVQQSEESLLQEALHELSELQKEVLQLRIWSEMSYADIGTTLELSENSVKSHLKRIKQILLKKLKKTEGTYER